MCTVAKTGASRAAFDSNLTEFLIGAVGILDHQRGWNRRRLREYRGQELSDRREHQHQLGPKHLLLELEPAANRFRYKWPVRCAPEAKSLSALGVCIPALAKGLRIVRDPPYVDYRTPGEEEDRDQRPADGLSRAWLIRRGRCSNRSAPRQSDFLLSIAPCRPAPRRFRPMHRARSDQHGRLGVKEWLATL